MSDPPPPPQVSADGKFYWDGQRWVPTQQSPLPARSFDEKAKELRAGIPPVPASRKVLGCVAIVVILIGAAFVGAEMAGWRP
jgi:hypothetical protein